MLWLETSATWKRWASFGIREQFCVCVCVRARLYTCVLVSVCVCVYVLIILSASLAICSVLKPLTFFHNQQFFIQITLSFTRTSLSRRKTFIFLYSDVRHKSEPVWCFTEVREIPIRCYFQFDFFAGWHLSGIVPVFQPFVSRNKVFFSILEWEKEREGKVVGRRN